MVAPLYVSYYTPDYAARAAVLVRSLRKFELDFAVVPIDELGSWQKNTHFKPQFVWNQLVANPGRPVVWVDADAELLQYPHAFDHGELGDIGVCEYKHKFVDRTELLSGTVYFKNTAASLRLVDRWLINCRENPELWDQRCLRMALNLLEKDLAVTWLPLSYCFVFDNGRRDYPEIEPIIQHYQESRAAKMRKPSL
jgi:hypothetical protein